MLLDCVLSQLFFVWGQKLSDHCHSTRQIKTLPAKSDKNRFSGKKDWKYFSRRCVCPFLCQTHSVCACWPITGFYILFTIHLCFYFALFICFGKKVTRQGLLDRKMSFFPVSVAMLQRRSLFIFHLQNFSSLSFLFVVSYRCF